VKIKNRETIYDGFFKVEKVTAELNGHTLKRDLVTNKDAVAALVYDTVKQEYLLIEQFRFPPQKALIEIVAGLLDKPDEKPEAAIKREIAEEIGYETDKLEFIASFYSTPGSYSEKITLYYAEVSRKTGKGCGVATEHEEIKTVAFSEEKLISHPFEDAKTLLAAYWVKAGKPK